MPKIINPTSSPVTLVAPDGSKTIINPGFIGRISDAFMWQFPDSILKVLDEPRAKQPAPKVEVTQKTVVAAAPAPVQEEKTVTDTPDSSQEEAVPTKEEKVEKATVTDNQTKPNQEFRNQSNREKRFDDRRFNRKS